MNVRKSESVTDFKINLRLFRNSNFDKAIEGNYWDVSYEVLSRIEGPNYLASKKVHNEYLKLNPFVAKKRFINMHSSENS